jgi:hypothetical protein
VLEVRISRSPRFRQSLARPHARGLFRRMLFRFHQRLLVGHGPSRHG